VKTWGKEAEGWESMHHCGVRDTSPEKLTRYFSHVTIHSSRFTRLKLLRLGEAVAHAPHRLHVSGLGGVRLDFFAEAVDMGVDGVAVPAVLLGTLAKRGSQRSEQDSAICCVTA
jgi:hypothetical protein